MTLSTISVTCRFGLPAERVFDAWLDPAIAGKWLFATASRPMARVAIDPRVEGAFRLVDDHDGEDVPYTGKYLEIVRPRRLAFTLHGDRRLRIPTRVVVDIVPSGRYSRVTVIHENLPRADAHRAECRWTGMLYGLGVTLGASRRAGGRHFAPVVFRKGPMRRTRSELAALVPAGGRPMSKSGLPQRL